MGLDISWEKEFLTKEKPEENPGASFGKWSCVFGGVLGSGFDQEFAFCSQFPGIGEAQGALAAPRGLEWGIFWGIPGSLTAPRLQISNAGTLWDGIIPIPSSYPAEIPKPGEFFCWRTTIGAEGPSSKWNIINLGKNLGFSSTKFQFLVCSALPALLFWFFFSLFHFSFGTVRAIFWQLCALLRAQQRILDHPNRIGNSWTWKCLWSVGSTLLLLFHTSLLLFIPEIKLKSEFYSWNTEKLGVNPFN